MPEFLPSTWVQCRLGDVVTYGGEEKVQPEEIPADAWIVELEDIERNTSKLLQRVHSNERPSKSTKSRFAAGDVLYGKLRPYLNKVIRADGGGYCTTEIIPVRGSAAVASDFLYYSLRRPAFVQYATSVSHGLSMPRLGTDAAKRAPFPLAPHDEQARITVKLDALVGRVDACRGRLDRVLSIIRRFRESVITAATSGELTADWRVTQMSEKETRAVSPRSWTLRLLGDLTLPGRGITYGVIKLGREVPDGVPCLRTSNVKWLRIESEGVKRIAPSISAAHGRTVLRGGEVLVNVRGTLGGVALATAEMIGWNVSREIAVVPPDPESVHATYLAYWIGSAKSQRWLTRVERGVAYVGINLEDLRRLPVELPSMAEQREIVGRVEALLEFAYRLETRYNIVRAAVDKITPASIAKAFRGQLVPQDPSDEPAQELLERVRAAAPGVPSTTRKRKSQKESHMAEMNPESVKRVIALMPERFTFDELRTRTTGDYETLSQIVLALLGEAEPVLSQYFDSEIRAMRFLGKRS